MNEATPGIGHNVDPFTESQNRVEELTDTANQWIEKCKEIQDEDQAGRANDFRAQIRAAKTDVENKRKDEVKPLNDQVTAINTKFKALVPFLDESLTRLNGLLEPWLQKLEEKKQKEARQAREEAETRRREAEAAKKKAEEGTGHTIQAAVQAKQAEEEAEKAEKEAAQIEKSKPQVKGDYSGKSTGFRTTWKAKITDIDKAFEYYKVHPKVVEALEKLGNADARGGRRRIPGFEIFSEKSVS